MVNVEDEANRVSTDASSNGAALVLRQKELATLSDDPDELQQQLQAMAGPAAGPNGGQIYIDGFTGGNLPAKSSIREGADQLQPLLARVRPAPAFGRIEILTRPGTDTIRGQAFFQFNNESLNSRSPLLTQSDPAPLREQVLRLYHQRSYPKTESQFRTRPGAPQHRRESPSSWPRRSTTR